MSGPEHRHDEDRTGNGIVNHGPENTPDTDPERERLTTVWRRYASVFSGSRTRLRAEWTRMNASCTTSSQDAVSSSRSAARPSNER